MAEVEFHLTGGSFDDALIATATPTYHGWLAGWDTTTVPDGTYALQSVAYDEGGQLHPESSDRRHGGQLRVFRLGGPCSQPRTGRHPWAGRAPRACTSWRVVDRRDLGVEQHIHRCAEEHGSLGKESHMATEDKAADKVKELKGKAKEAVGDVTDDDTLKGEGAADQTEGNLKQAGEKVKDAFRRK